MLTSQPTRRRKRARHVSQLLLTIDQTFYAIRPLRCDSSVAQRAFRLQKFDGTFYNVAQTDFGGQCDCPDFIFRREEIDPEGCKHIRALVAHGMMGSKTGRRPK